MTVNRSDFQRRFKAAPDADDRFIGHDPGDGTGDPFVTDLAGMAGGLAPLIAVDTELSSRYASLAVLTTGQGGFEPTFVSQGYGFLCYGPTGQMLAANFRSTGGRTLAVSTDEGATWTDTGTPSASNVIQFAWLLSDNSILLACNDGTLYRTTDLGATSTAVQTGLTGFLGQSIAEGTGGVVWLCPYNAPAGGLAPLKKSTDYGATWTTVATIKCSNVYSAAADVVRHPHGVFLIDTDPYVMTGDNGTECGFWKFDGASSLVRVTPSTTDPTAQQLRAVGAIVRGSYLYWIQDGAGSTATPKLCKAPTADLTQYTVVSAMPSGGWYLAKLSTGEIIVTGVIEGGGTETDSMVRMWCVDSNDKVAEIYQYHRLDAAPIAGNYGYIRSIEVDSSDNIAFVSVNGDMGDVTVVGKYRAGGRTFVHRAERGLVALGKSRTWSVLGSTSGPSTSATSGAPDVLAEMTLTIEAGVAPILISFGTSFSHNTVAGVTTFGIRVNGTNVNSREIQTKLANYIESTSITHLWTPVAPGKYTVDVAWNVNNGAHTALARYTERSLVAVELG